MALQFGPHQLLAGGIIAAPAFERSGHAGGDLRIHRIQGADHFAHQPVTRAVFIVEAQMVDAEGADQGAHPVGVLDVEGGMFISPRTEVTVSGRGELACRLIHLSSTSGSFSKRSWKWVKAASCSGQSIRVSAARPAIMSVILSALR